MSNAMATVEPPEQVLVFRLGTEDFCVDIGWVAEIVKPTAVSPVPDSPRMMQGVMDLRDVTTTIVDPKVTFGLDPTEGDQQVIIFETDDETSIGWLVDYTYQVEDVTGSELDPVEDNRYVRGVVKDEDAFTLWVDPTEVNSQLTSS